MCFLQQQKRTNKIFQLDNYYDLINPIVHPLKPNILHKNG